MPKGKNQPAFARLRGRFAHCTDSSDPTRPCRLDTNCKQPKTHVLAAQRTQPLQPPTGSKANVISCLPPTTTPVEFRIELDATPGEVNVGLMSQEVIQPEAADQTCFMDLFDVLVQP